MEQIIAAASFDVVIVGAGLAGLRAAVTAAKLGSTVLLCSKSVLCGGSSFYPLMDTLHCQGTLDEADKEILLQDIAACGCGMGDPWLNRYYVDNINARIEEFPSLGIDYTALPEPKLACFSHHAHALFSWTDWLGIRVRARRILAELPNVTLWEQTDAAALLTQPAKAGGARVHGIVLYDKQTQAFREVACKSVVLATGGFGALFQHSLNGPDVAGDGHALALAAGAGLVNLEFNQFIPGYLTPVYKIVFREGTLDYCTGLRDSSGQDPLRVLLPNEEDYRRCLKLRAAHGPFTSADESRFFDAAIMQAGLRAQGQGGCRLLYDNALYDSKLSYMVHYLDWLRDIHHLNLCRDDAALVPFFHAANGGILVNHQCETAVIGLFACGEAAGGIHGADRLGGHATGSCLVFGHLAAQSAVAHAQATSDSTVNIDEARLTLQRLYGSTASQLTPNEAIDRIQKTLWLHANVLRTEAGLAEAQRVLDDLAQQYCAFPYLENGALAPAAMQAQRMLTLAQALLLAMQARKESRGPHYREDHPKQSASYDHRLLLTGIGQDLHCRTIPIA